MEDNFSPAGGKGLFRMTQVHYIYYATADLKGGGAQAVIRMMRATVNTDEAVLAHSPLCSQVPNRP